MTRDELAAQGRNGDTEVGHLTTNEMIIPPSVFQSNPDLLAMVLAGFETAGLDPGRYTVGGDDDSINPETELPEFNDGGDNEGGGGSGAAGTGGSGGAGPGGGPGGPGGPGGEGGAGVPGEGPEAAAGLAGGGMGPASPNSPGQGLMGDNPPDEEGRTTSLAGPAMSGSPMGLGTRLALSLAFPQPIAQAMRLGYNALQGQRVADQKPDVVEALEGIHNAMAGIGVPSPPTGNIGRPNQIVRA